MIAAADPGQSEAILNGYLQFLEKKGTKVVPDGDGVYRFVDPYYRSSGKMNLRREGAYIWGLFGDDPEQTTTYIKQITVTLKAKGLLEG